MPERNRSSLSAVGEIQREHRLPVQSHLSENPEEIAWVRQLAPWSQFYGDAYDHFGLFGGEVPTICSRPPVFGSQQECVLLSPPRKWELKQLGGDSGIRLALD